MAQIQAKFDEYQRKIDKRVQAILSGNEAPEEPEVERFQQNHETRRSMLRASKGFTPEKRAQFVREMNEMGVVCMDEDGVPQTRRGIIRRS